MNSNAVIGSVLIKSEPTEELPAEQQAIDQPTNMVKPKEPEDRQSIGDQLKLVLNLNYSTRNQLITSLNNLSAILQCNKTIPNDAKQRTRQKIDETMRLLVDLSPFEPAQANDGSGMFEELISDELTVKLSRAERSRVIDHLIDIKDAVLSDGLITGETKRSLVTENRSIIDQLLDLRSDEDQKENHCEPSSKRQRVESVLNEELDNLKAVTKSQGEKIASLEARMDGLKSELKREIESVDTTRTEVLFKFELTGVSKFFEVDANERHSERFWCRGLQWSLFVEPSLKRDRSKHLGLYLHCHNDDPLKWSCKVDCKLILFSNLSEAQNCFDEFVNTFDKKVSFGYSHFISYRELIDEKNGYLKDDKIVLGAELKAGPVVKEGQPEGSRSV